MLNDYIPVFSIILSIFVIALLYDSIQTLLKRKSSRLNRKLALAINIVVILAIFALIGIMFYLITSTIISAVNGTNEIFNWEF